MATIFKNKLVDGIGTSPTTVLTSDAVARTTVIGLSMANMITSPLSVNVQVVDTITGDSAYYLYDVVVPIGQSLRAINGGERLVLGPSTEVRITSNYATSLDVVMSYVEIS
jgi:hypothetical protein